MKKMKVKSVGLRKKTTGLLWVLLAGSLFFGIYKNFTAIDQHTVHEEKIIHTKIVDTNLISSYVNDFVKVFYAWEPRKEALETRVNMLNKFFPEELQRLNQEMIRSDIPTKSIVKDIKIWKIQQINDEDYSVIYSVVQDIEESKGDKKENRQIESAFSVQVKTNGNDKLVIHSNPVMASAPGKLITKGSPDQDDIAVTQATKDEIQNFLETFFKVYPSAKKTELLYYVSQKDLKEINKTYVFSEIKQINYFKTREGVKVKTVAMYLDQETKAVFPFTYTLSLNKTEKNWVINNGL